MKKVKVLEEPRGKGTILRGDQTLFTAPYRLRVTQDVDVSRMLDGSTQETELSREVRGFLINVDPWTVAPLVGENLILLLQDGRRLPMFFKDEKGSLVGRTWFEE
jgi:hypothetical protein